MGLNEWCIERAYALLDTTVPMQFDCGLLCDKKCCSGNSDNGMLLFPGEEKLFANLDGFVIKESSLGKTLICNGTCDRAVRPIACRIFPLFPYVISNENGYKISILKDIRAMGYCPLDDADIPADFKRGVRLAARCLMRDSDCAQFLLKLTEAMTDIGKFY